MVEIIKWAEDSKSIIVSASKKGDHTQHDILKISLTETTTVLYSTIFRPKDISYSSDGKKVAFIDNGLHIANSDFTEISRVDTSVSSCCWSNSSETLFYIKHQIRNKKFEDDIWKYD